MVRVPLRTLIDPANRFVVVHPSATAGPHFPWTGSSYGASRAAYSPACWPYRVGKSNGTSTTCVISSRHSLRRPVWVTLLLAHPRWILRPLRGAD